MSRGLIKSTFREIKESFGRYMAIFLIVALGVGFFAGLKVAYSAMVHTADIYLKNQTFYDYHLLSTLGFDEDAEELLAGEVPEAIVEGSKSADVLMVDEEGTERVIKTMERPGQINKPELTAGRMPENAAECLVDEHAFSEDAIGSKLMIAETNEAEDSDRFKEKEYTIVGLVRSPLYIHYQRGSAAIGDGTIDGYVYVEPEAYDMDYDTDLYILFDEDIEIYSDQYIDFVDSKEELFEELCQTIADARYMRIYTEAYEEIEEAEATLKEKMEEGEKELGDALEELNDGKRQMEEGEQAIRDAKNTLARNEKKLQTEEKNYQQGLKDYQEQEKAFQKGKTAYDQGVRDYNTGYAEYETGRVEYETNLAAYEESENQYEEAYAQYDAGKTFLSEEERQEKEQEFAIWRESLDATAGTLSEAKTQLEAAQETFTASKAALDQEGKKITKAQKQLASAKKQLESAGSQIEEAKNQLVSAKNQISEKERELEEAKAELADGQADYDAAKREYDEKIKEAQQELADAREELEGLEEPDTYVLERDSNIGYESFRNDSEIIEGVAKVFPIFFFLVAALVCMTTMARMMEEQRTQVGILKALGYSDGAVIAKYIIYSGSAAVMGAVVGFLAGTWVFSLVIWSTYKLMYDMGELRYIFKPGYAMLSVLVALLCSVGTTFVSCRGELREMASSLMRPKPPKVGKRVLLEKISFLWNRLQFLDKVSIRNLFRYKKRLFMMVIGVSGCTALLVTGMGIRDSIAGIAKEQFDTITVYDLAVGIRKGAVQVEGMGESLLLTGQSVDLENSVQSVNLLVPESGENFSDYMDLHDEDGKAVAFPGEGQAVISFKLAENYNIKVGDRVSFRNSDLKGGSVIVSGIYRNYFNHYAILSRDTYQSLFDEEPEYNEMYVNVKEGADVRNVSAELMKQNGVTYVSVCEDTKQHVSDMFGSLDYVVILVVVCAALLAFVVIYNLNNINITERIREIATIKVLGFYKEETNSYVFRENSILTLLGSLAGILLGYYLHAFVMNQIHIDAVAFNVHVEPVSYIISVVLTLFFNQMVNFFMAGKLENIDMAESLKSVE